MSGLLASIGFSTPWLLTGLAVLPLIWWLFRLNPPRPRQQDFPPTRILRRLMRREDQPERTPWWLVLLRLAAAGLVVLALAGALWQPDRTADAAREPLWLVIDNGWAAAPDWPARKATAESLLAHAARKDRPVALVLTADGPGQPLDAMAAGEAGRRLTAAAPRPWAPDRAALDPGLTLAAARVRPGSVAYLADGVADAGGGMAGRLARLTGAPVTLYRGDPAGLAAIVTVDNDAEAMTTTLRRLPGPAGRMTVRALDEKGRELARGQAEFAEGADQAAARFVLPTDLRNDVARVEIADLATAAAVHLVDDRWRRRRVGLVNGGTAGAEQPLLSPTHYLRRALQPFADLVEPRAEDTHDAIAELVSARVSVIMLADIGTLLPETEDQLTGFVRDGGVLVRFAGPRLAQAVGRDDPLVPVPLRQGGRTLGGALSWSEPQKLGDFNPAGPFAGLAVPGDVTVSRQVLAEPRPDLAAATWASLTDGTPLVTGRSSGQGWLVLVHVSADTSWSSLPLSGTFVDMLRRVVAVSRASAATTDGGGVLLSPYRLIDGFGRLDAVTGSARPLDPAALAATRAAADHPPGLYGTDDGVVALNLMRAEDRLVADDVTGATTVRALALGGETDLRAWLIGTALALFLIEFAAVLATSGALRRRVGLAGLALLLAVSVPPPPARAAEAAPAALTTRLAFVLTGRSDTDETARAGLAGLSRVLTERTAFEPGEPVGVDIERDELAFFPLIYWPVDAAAPRPSATAIRRVDAYMKNGGTILFDTRDSLTDLTLRAGGSPSAANRALREILASIDIPPLEPVPETHVLSKSFYLLSTFPGRYADSPLWVEAPPADSVQAADRPVRAGDGVSPILITGNDLAGAWAVDEAGTYLHATVPADARQREMAYRVGVNIVMYTLTGNYKADQVHVPALLERLGQ